MARVRNQTVLVSFGERFRNVRKAHGFTQESLSEKSGITLSQIARIETGRINTTVSTIYAIAEAMEIEPKLFF